MRRGRFGVAASIFEAPADGKTYGRKNKTWVDLAVDSCEFSFKFEVAEAFAFVCPEALKFTSMEYQQTNAPTLSVALNTNMAKFDNLVITPDAVGLVILKGVFL